MNKIKSLLFFVLLSVLSQAQTPNVLLVIADDMGTDALNGYTNQALKPITPTLDSLQGMGLPLPMHGLLLYVLLLAPVS